MNISELMLKVNNISFDDIVCQTEIQTEKDKEKLVEIGFESGLTEKEFRERFPGIDPRHIHYGSSLSCGCFYFNRESFAVCPTHLEIFLYGLDPNVQKLYEVIEQREKQASEGYFLESAMFLPDGMRMEYFRLLFRAKRDAVKEPYELFRSIYSSTDYGFGSLDSETMDFVFSRKTETEIERTRQAVKELDCVVRVYRGQNSQSTPWDMAYSWTLDINVAYFFACRHGYGPATIVKAWVERKDILEYLDEGSEKEVWVSPKKLRSVKEMPLLDMDYLKVKLPEVASMYRTYRDMMYGMDFAMESEIYGISHQARVLLLSLFLADQLNLSLYERQILATAAIYHDTQMATDAEDEEHGQAASEYYAINSDNPDKLVEFLCRYHCLPDQLGLYAIHRDKLLKKNAARAIKLLYAFKDADALDRIRLPGGFRELDISQLRYKESQQLVLVAKICLDQIKV